MSKKKRRPGRPKRYKVPAKARVLRVYVDPENKKWIDEQVKRSVFGGKSHAVNYCITIMRTVFEQREEQIMQLAQSGQMGSIVNSIDSAIKGGEDGQQPGPENPESPGSVVL